MAGRIGLDMKLFRNTGTAGGGSPTWSEMTNAKDVTVNLEKGDADVSTRASIWRTHRATLIDGTLDFQMVYDPDDDSFAAFEAAFLAGDLVDVAAVDDEGNGLRFVGELFNFTRAEPLEDAVVVSASIKPSVAVESVTGVAAT